MGACFDRLWEARDHMRSTRRPLLSIVVLVLALLVLSPASWSSASQPDTYAPLPPQLTLLQIEETPEGCVTVTPADETSAFTQQAGYQSLECPLGALQTADSASLAGTADVPPAPQLISPSNESRLDTLLPVLRINTNISGVQMSVRIEYSVNSDFAPGWGGSWTAGPGTQPEWNFQTGMAYHGYNLQPSARYYWRARAGYGSWQGAISWGPYSPTWTFTTGSNGIILNGPELLSPQDGAPVYNPRPTLRWQPLPAAQGFFVLASPVAGGPGYGWECQNCPGDSVTFWTDLPIDSTWKWSARLRNSYAWGAESSTKRFTVRQASISGRVSDARGNGVAGVTIADGSGKSALTGSDGSYTLGGYSAGLYTITATKQGYVFCPHSRKVDLSSEVMGQDFRGFDSNLALGFCPDPEGYRFSNSSDAWGRYPESAHDYRHDDLIRMFGYDNVCVLPEGVSDSCWVKPQADLWHVEANEIMNGGHCDGMASTSLRFFKNLDSVTNFSALAKTPHDLALNEARRHVAYYFVKQLTDPVNAYKEQIRQRPPSAILAQLRTSVQLGTADPVTLFIRKAGEGGHAVVPYALEDRGNGVWWIRVYDNNHPDDLTSTLVIDTAHETWSYNLGWTTWTGDASTKSLGIVPISKYAEQPVCPWCGDSAGARAPDGPTQMQEVWLRGSGHLLIADNEGRKLGYLGTTFVSEIPGAYGAFVDGGAGVDQEPVYKLPVGTPYTILLDGQTVSTSESTIVSQFGPGYAAQIDEIQLGAGTNHTMTIAADGSAISYIPSARSKPTFSLALDEAGASYKLQIADAEVDARAPVTVAIRDGDGRLVYNHAGGDGGEYTVVMKRLSGAGAEWFVHRDVALAAGDTHQVAYRDWHGREAAILEIDAGSDGSIDRTVELENEVRRVFLPVLFGK